jgi:cobalt-zinc-cadmium efflux system protein
MAHTHSHAHDHGHDHDHDHHGSGHGHAHAHGDRSNAARVGLAALLTGGFMTVEVVGGVISGSLALLADAGHMLSDFASLMLAWVGFRIARRPADNRRTFGFARFSILAAFTNGLALAAIGVWILIEAGLRLYDPHPVAAATMLWIAAAGLVVNLVAFATLHGADRDNLNIRGALAHVAGDLLGSVAAILAGLIILWTGWTPADPILSALVALILMRSAWSLIRDAGHVLLEGAPSSVDVRAVSQDLVQNVAGVLDVHHAHAWSLDGRRPMMTLHARVAEEARADAVLARIKERLLSRHGIDHATVEIEQGDCPGHACA